MAERFTLRPATDQDEAFLQELHAAHRGPEFAQLPAELRAPLLAGQYRAQRADYRSRFSQGRHEIVEVDGAPAGRIWVATEREALRLVDVTLLPAHQGRGIGSALLCRLQDEARTAGKAVCLHVAADNRGAQRLYERHGFVQTGEPGAPHVEMVWHA